MAGQNLDIPVFMWLLNSSVADSRGTRLSNISPAHSIRHTVSANADWFKAASLVLHLARYHAYYNSNSAKIPQWSVARVFTWSEFIHEENYGSGLPGLAHEALEGKFHKEKVSEKSGSIREVFFFFLFFFFKPLFFRGGNL